MIRKASSLQPGDLCWVKDDWLLVTQARKSGRLITICLDHPSFAEPIIRLWKADRSVEVS